MRNRLHLFLIIAGGVLIFIFLPLFLLAQTRLARVIVIGNISHINGLNLFNNQNLIFLDKESMRQKLLKANIILEDIWLEKKYPNSLILQIKERKPVARLIADKRQIYYDKEGIILERINIPVFVPQIKIDNSTLLKSKKDWRIIKAIKIIEDFGKVNINVENIVIADAENTFVVWLMGNGQVIIPYDGDIPNLAASLQIIQTRFRIEGKIIEKIDFRFEKPTVILENGEKISSSIK